jgi:hypothetical protein
MADPIGLTQALAGLILAVIDIIKKVEGDDNEKRAAFTRQTVEDARQQFPDYNVVIIHPAHTVSGERVHQHVELGMAVGTCGYEVYLSRAQDSFTLTNNGDGGFINWAFIGYNRDGNRIWSEAAPPPPPPPEQSWSAWESLGGLLTSAPAAVSWGAGRIDVFARGEDDGLYCRSFDGSWTEWEGLGGEGLDGSLKSELAPAVSSWAPGRLDLFAIGEDDALWHRWFR